jgi:hypothetical protein
MKFRAVVTNEKTGDAPWFVYVEGASNGRVMAARFPRLAQAEKVARVMNEAWAESGLLDEPCRCVYPEKCFCSKA